MRRRIRRYFIIPHSTMKKNDLKIFFETLQTMYPENRTDLIWETPWQLLIAVVMSAQTTDKQVNKVTEKFFNKIKSPRDTLATDFDKWTQYIKGVNYAPTKSKNLYKTAQLLTQDQIQPNYNIPDNQLDLIKLS